MIAWLLALGALSAGAAQASLLARSAGRSPSPFSALARLLLVGSVLLVAARAGYLVPAALCWMLGFGAACGLAYRRLR